jgi:MoaD family protein
VAHSLQVSVRFFTTLREIVGKKEEAIRFSPDEKVTVNTVLDQLSKEYGQAFKEYVYDHKTGQVRSFLQFLVNGRSVSSSEGLDSELSDCDVLAILPPVSGG